MARKTDIVRIPAGSPDDNRDQGKVYLLTEMSAMKAEKWAARALMALAAQGVDVQPTDGMAGLARAAQESGTDVLGKLRFDVVEPLLDEMMECVGFVGDIAKTDQITSLPITRPLMVDDDIEEVKTRLLLRARLIELHVNFLPAGTLSRLGDLMMRRISSSLSSLTSAPPSDSSSGAD